MNLGYLAFPATGSPLTKAAHDSIPKVSFSHTSTIPQPANHQESSPGQSSPPPIDHLQELHRARIEREEAERIKGEEDWVRSGGILRDSEGKRDFARTEKVREELRLRDWEREVQDRWDEYERRWSELQAKERRGDSISFDDIPWPVHVGGKKIAQVNNNRPGTWGNIPVAPKLQLSDITTENVENFLTEGLKIRGCQVTKKERVRTSFLRWHPDKMTGFVSKVVEEDHKDVEDGISVVIRCLQTMNTKH
ncbi:hypothetical protein EV361DRAFT_791219 [Lentinula raphanica]|nr:hypothetical protein F5880DRAFT_1473019 [Lentinula raphanica]KAJ3976005.1 hypothetical protein EV361DRAFT_791219 [Lentinula raphanica]